MDRSESQDALSQDSSSEIQPNLPSSRHTEYNVAGGYVPSFVEHLRETGARLGLGVPSEINDVQDSHEHSRFETHAFSHWSPAECDAFFRALSVHSRWRPDLIAACVPTRSEWEVWMHLEALQEGAAKLTMERGGEGVDADGNIGSGGEDVEMGSSASRSRSGSGSGSDSDSDSGKDACQRTCEPAYEVSQEWIDAEEVMASWVIHEESLALVNFAASDIDNDENESQGGVQKEVENTEEPPKRKRGRPPTSEKSRPRGRSRANKTSETVSPSPPPLAGSSAPRLSKSNDPSSSNAENYSRDSSPLSVRKRRRIELKRDALMGRLDPSQLLVLESISRESEEAIREGSRSREGSVAETSAFMPGPSKLSDAVPQTPSLPVPTQNTTINTSPFPQNAIIPDPEPLKTVDSDLSLLSPRGRRRLQKRLYMRRRRALLRDDSAVSETVLDTGIEKLKPGRKPKSERGETPRMPMSVPFSDIPSDEDMDTGKNEVTHSKGGLTLPYKLKAEFSRLGVDSAYLGARGIDLLNLGALGKLMGLFTSLEQRKQDEEGVDGVVPVEYIDAELIQHLQTALVTFVTDVLHRSFVWKEGEKKLKERSRAWRYGDQITISAIEHAVRSIGSRYQSHKQFFRSAVAFYGLTKEADATSEGAVDQSTSENTSADTDAGSPDGFAEPPVVLSLHRDMHTPHIRPPSELKMGALKYLSPTYEQEALRTRRGSSVDIEDDLMADETDEDALETELEEDDEMDVLDLQRSSEYEQSLWDTVTVTRKGIR